MSVELDKIVKMLESGNAELQCAAAMVLGELGSKEEKVHAALLGALKSDNEEVRLYAVEALARTRAKEAAPHFIPFLAGSPRLRGRVQQILAGLGDDIIPLLQKRIDKASPELRRGLLEVLGQFKQVDLSDTLFEALSDKDPEVVKQAAASLRERFASLKEDERPAAAKRMTAFLGEARTRKRPETVVAAIQVLQELRIPAVRTYLEFTAADQPPQVRAAALSALAATGAGDDEERVVAKLLPLLAEADQADIVSPALQVLSKAKIGKDHADRILKLQKSPHPAVRLFAIGALGGVGASKAAEGLIEGLWNSDARVAEEAAASLRSNPAFARPLVRALEGEEDAGRAWKLANVLRVHREAIDGATVASFLKRCLALHEKRGPAFQVYFEILRSVAPGDLRDAILKRARELMGKKRVEDADRMLRLLEREDLATGASDYLLAISQLRTLNKDLAMAPRDRSKAVLLFSKLVRRGEIPVVKNLEKDARLLAPLDLLYLGFVLIEREGAERELGAAVLNLLARKYASSKEAKTAKAKLKTQGI